MGPRLGSRLPRIDTVQDNETAYLDSIGTAMALHTRYPGHRDHTTANSQLARTLSLMQSATQELVCISRVSPYQTTYGMMIPLHITGIVETANSCLSQYFQ